MRIQAVLFSLLLAGCCCRPSKSTPTSGASPSPASSNGVPVATLLKDYEDNEVRADGLYKGKRIEIVGVVTDIGVTLGQPHVNIGPPGNRYGSSIRCSFDKSENDKIAALAKGTPVVVEGKVLGKFMGVSVSDCKIAQ